MAQFLQGRYTPKNPEKYVGDKADIIFRSSWERKFMIWCDNNPAVVGWLSEYPIPYFSQVDEKMHRYFVDFFVKIRGVDGREVVLMVEVKPSAEQKVPRKPKINNLKAQARYMSECRTYVVNQNKWEAAEKYADDHGFKFIVLNEYDLGIAKRGV